MYDPKALKQGIKKCRQNIEMFEDLIEKEEATIAEYKGLIKGLKKKADISKKIVIDSKGVDS
ncbi:MAG: hypothetical protein ABFQ62_00175 [Patescibacteria group bacterium]